MSSELAIRQNSIESALWMLIILVKETLKKIETLVKSDDDEICRNIQKLFQLISYMNQAKNEVKCILKDLECNINNIGNALQKLMVDKKEYEDRLTKLEEERNCWHTRKITALNEYDICKERLREAENELKTEEDEIQKAEKHNKTCGEVQIAGAITSLSGTLIGGVLLIAGVAFPLALPFGVATLAASGGVGGSMTIGGRIATKSKEYMEMLNNNKNYAQQRVDEKQRIKDKTYERWKKCDQEVNKVRSQIREKEESLIKSKESANRMETWKHCAVGIQQMLLHYSVQVLRDKLKDHKDVGISKRMEKLTKVEYRKFRQVWEQTTCEPYYRMLMYLINDRDEKDFIIFIIGCYRLSISP